MKLKHIVFIPASREIMSQLYRRGISFSLVNLNGKSVYMVETNQLRLMKELALSQNITTLFISDNRRQTFKLDLIDRVMIPTKLGTLKRSTEDKSGTFCLIVSENNTTYYYSTH